MERESESIRSVRDRHVIINATRIDYSTGDTGRLYTVKDVSEIRRLEESARRKLTEEHAIARYTFDDVVGEAPAIRTCLAMARLMAESEATILLEGESGTGKELMAQSIHNASPRRHGPFIPVNFAAMTESLLESELFGYEAGAFTGAMKEGSMGLFEAAHKGTIFLDEIGDAPLPFQVKLLRVLQEMQIKRVGSSRMTPIDVRVIAATNRKLKELADLGLFRRDLYYRLNVLPLRLPPLRERLEDIAPLAGDIYRKLSGREPGSFFSLVMPALQRHAWPGNIRELRNLVHYLLHICLATIPTPDLLPEELRGSTPFAGDDAARVYGILLQAASRGESLGRRSLARLGNLLESRVRKALGLLAAEGKVKIGKGRRGISLA